MLAAAVPFFKVFLGAHLLLGVGAILLLRGRPFARAIPLLVFSAPCALATAALVLFQEAAHRETLTAELIEEAKRGQATLGEIPSEAVADLNRVLGAQVVRRIARRRARVMLGRELPFGMGVALGGIYNFRQMHSIGRTAIKHLQPAK